MYVKLEYETYCSILGSSQQTRGERCLVTNFVGHQRNQRGICSLSSIPPVNTRVEDLGGACARTSELCGRLHVESDRDLRPSVRDALRGYRQIACTPTRWHDTRAGVTSRQNRCIAPREVGRAKGYTSALVKLFGKSSIRWCIVGGNLDESICERLDRACKLRVLRTVRRIGARSNVGRKLLKESERCVGHLDRTDRLPREECVIQLLCDGKG